MCFNSKVRKLTFTGSTNVGKILMRQGADQVLKLGLELGGNAPFIVFDDADVDAAVEGAMISKFRNNGQTCVCANRLYVQSGVYDAFAAKLAARVAQLKVGDGFADGVQAGPLISEKALVKVEEHIADALEQGAQVNTGGNRDALGGLFFQPTVLTGVTGDMKVAREETFGPVAPLFPFRDGGRGYRAGEQYGVRPCLLLLFERPLKGVSCCGSAGIRHGGCQYGLISTEVAPFGGIKQSGRAAKDRNTASRTISKSSTFA